MTAGRARYNFIGSIAKKRDEREKTTSDMVERILDNSVSVASS
jgi:ABC-type sulfate transport system substrate-binding protein